MPNGTEGRQGARARVGRAEPGGGRTQPARTEPRSWTFSLLWAIGVVGLFILASATINPLFGRSVHWDWMAGIAPAEFVVIALALRRRWI